MAEYIKLDKKKINRLRNEAHQFDTDIACAIGTDFMQNIAEAENRMILDILNGLENEATADVVGVVRCGKCEHFKEYPIIDTSVPSGWGKCTKINMDIDLTINDFCSYGERRCEE